MDRVARQLVVGRIPADELTAVVQGRRSAVDFGMGAYLEETYGKDWTLVSHTFDLMPDGGAIYTVVFERPDRAIQQGRATDRGMRQEPPIDRGIRRDGP